MRVVLAEARGADAAGITVDLPAAEARQLIHDGRARAAGEDTTSEPVTTAGPETPRPRRQTATRRTKKET